MKALKVIGWLVVALAVAVNVIYWQDPWLWRRYVMLFDPTPSEGLEPFDLVKGDGSYVIPVAAPENRMIRSRSRSRVHLELRNLSRPPLDPLNGCRPPDLRPSSPVAGRRVVTGRVGIWTPGIPPRIPLDGDWIPGSRPRGPTVPGCGLQRHLESLPREPSDEAWSCRPHRREERLNPAGSHRVGPGPGCRRPGIQALPRAKRVRKRLFDRAGVDVRSAFEWECGRCCSRCRVERPRTVLPPIPRTSFAEPWSLEKSLVMSGIARVISQSIFAAACLPKRSRHPFGVATGSGLRRPSRSWSAWSGRRLDSCSSGRPSDPPHR